jgi:glycosyltransferase involved in cell wall biosynthesis
VPRWDRRMIVDHLDPLVPRRVYGPYQDLKAAWAIAKRFRAVHAKERFDLVQVANVLAVGLFVRSAPGAAVVARMSSYRPLWDTIGGVRPDLPMRVRWKMEELSIRGRRFICAPSRFVAVHVQRNYQTPPISVVESPFFAEEVRYDDSIYRARAAGKRYLLYFGRMLQMKGVHILARALPKLFGRFDDLHMICIGADADGPDGMRMRDYVRAQAGPYASRVELIDPLRHDQLYPFIDHAVAVVLPSLADNLPNTLLEAMGHGRVVVGTTGSCFEQLIEHGHNGLLVPPGDVEALAAALADVWRMPEAQRQHMGAAAKERVAELHPDRAIPRLIEYYESVIRQYRTTGRS